MSFLRPDYNKPGPGVEKNEPPKPGYVRFWSLYFRNFTKMLMYGIEYFVVVFPLICFVFFFIVGFVNPEILDNLVKAQTQANNQLTAEGEVAISNLWASILSTVIVSVPSYISLPLLALSAIAYGPMTCGIVYCMRNHTREEHVWATDIFVRAWKNAKQGLFFGFLDIAVTLSVLIYLYSGDSLGMSGWIYSYLRILGVAVFVVYALMRWYIYQMIVTFNLKIGGLLKNAWMFVILGFGRNLIAAITSVIFIVFWILLPVFFPQLIPLTLLVMISLFWSFLWFLQVFATYPVMHKYLVAPALAERAKKEKMERRAKGIADDEEDLEEENEENSEDNPEQDGDEPEGDADKPGDAEAGDGDEKKE
jgi:uncharacterized membrane protein YesL